MTITYPNSRVERLIRELGFRLTPQRDLILRALAARGEHTTFDEIYADVRKMAPQISAATVYRNLELFSRYRLIHGNEVAGGMLYEIASESSHHHLVCHNCWGDTKIPDSQVRELFQKMDEQTGFLVLGEHYIFMGLCPDCRKKIGDKLGRFAVYPKFRRKTTKEKQK